MLGSHRRSQDFCLGGGTWPTPPSLASVVHTFEAGSWGSVSAPAVSRVMGGVPEWNKNSITYTRNYIQGKVFVNVVSLKYIGMIYITVGEMWFIPMNGVRQLRWQHLSHVVSTFSTSIRLLSSFFIKHTTLPPAFSLFLSTCLSLPLFLWYPIPFSLVVFPCGLDMLMFSSCNPKFFAVS